MTETWNIDFIILPVYYFKAPNKNKMLHYSMERVNLRKYYTIKKFGVALRMRSID